MLLFFFFQAEDGIRDVAVTGVQTCALPISGDLGEVVALIAVASGARLTGNDLVRRAEMLAERVAAMKDRVNGPVQALQLVVYERAVPIQERDFVLEQARKAGLFPLARARVATWVFA